MRRRGEACKSCRFIERPRPDVPAGLCHKRTPTVLMVGLMPPKIQGQNPTVITETHWPQVGLEDWCGDWEADTMASFTGIDLSKIGEEGTA